MLATLGGLVIPGAAAIVAALLLGPPRLPHASRTAALAAALLTVAEAVFAGLGAAALVEAAWRRVGLPGAGPANFLPLRWIRHRIAHRHVQGIIDQLRQSPAQPSKESLRSLLDLSRELARRDIYTRAHSGRVSRLSVELGQRIGLSPEECETARLAGLLHDIGKLEIPASILNKPGPLDPDEADLVRSHPIIGAALVAPYIGLDVVNAVRHHHERVDGAGYPDGVDLDSLSTIARLVPVVDTYDALISDRSYRPGRSREEAFLELRAVAGSQLDPEMVEALIEVEQAKVPFGGAVLGLAPVGALVRKAEHLLHGSAAPAAAAVTAIAVAGAGWLGVMSTTGTAVSAGRDNRTAITTTTPAPSPLQNEGAGPTPAAPIVTTQSPSGTPTPSPGAKGKTVAPLYFPAASGKGKGTAGTLVTPPKAGDKTNSAPTVLAVGSSPLPPPSAPSNNPPPAQPSSNPPPPPAPPPAPFVGAISPASGGSGIPVTISGNNFGAATAVNFGTVSASGFSVSADGSTISVNVPPGNGKAQITVNGPGGASSGNVTYQYLGPTITAINGCTQGPSCPGLFGPSNGGNPVVISGTNMLASTVTIGQATVAVVNSSDNAVTVPAPSLSAAGAAENNVCVTTPTAQTCTASGGQDLQYDYNPNLTGSSPSSGSWVGNTTIRLSGTNLGEVTEIEFGGQSYSVQAHGDNPINFKVPAWDGSGGNQSNSIRLRNSAGTSDDIGAHFDYNTPPRPHIAGLSPSTAAVTDTMNGITVSISGSGFVDLPQSHLVVTFNGQQASCSGGTLAGSGSLSCTVTLPAPGIYAVVVTTVSGQSNGAPFIVTP